MSGSSHQGARLSGRTACLVLVPATWLLAFACAHGQISPNAPPNPRSAMPDIRNTEGDDAFLALTEQRLKRVREKERQKRVLDDAAQLVALTERYRKQCADHEKATVEDAKLLAQIEKLARDLRSRMLGQN